MTITKMIYVGIAMMIIGLASVLLSAGTDWFFAPGILTAIGGAVAGDS